MKLRINLSIMQPSGYIHSQGFIDQARYARFQFRRHGVEVTISKNRLREDSVNIIFGAHLGFNPELKNRYTCVFFNLEQLGEGGATVSEDYIKLLKTSAVIDYDERNLVSYGGTTNNVPIVSFQYAPYLAENNTTSLKERPIDLLFFGSINERRKALFQRIEASGCNISVFDNPLYCEERDHYIKQAKAVLNCHFYETSRFEQARAFHSISLGTPVISERTDQTTPHPAFENAITWFNSNQVEIFFQREFKTNEWIKRAEQQLHNFSTTDCKIQWQNALHFCQVQHELGDKSEQIWTPKYINLGSGKDYRLGWLNIDIQEKTQPDLIINLGNEVSFPIKTKTAGGGNIAIEENSILGIYANNVLEHVPDLPCLMSNLLKLLKENGVLEIEVPYEKSVTAWQDPTHIRAMNMNSWLYFTNWFWYLGWFEHRFEISSFQWLDSEVKPCHEDQAAFMKVKLIKTCTTLHERAIARTMQPDFGGISSDYFK